MKSLFDLPNEILLEILAYLSLEKPSLCQLARTSRRLGILTRPLMTQDIDFTKFEEESNVRRYRLLIRKIKRNQSIAQSVRTVTMFTSAEEKITNLSHALLKGLQDLRTLTFVSVRIHDDTYPRFFSKNPMPSLQKITFEGSSRVEEWTLWKLMSLQGLESITIESIYDVDNPSPSDRKYRASPVLSLDLDRNILSANFMRELLTCPRALKKLRCSVPWHEDTSERPLEHTLEPAKHSLTELVLVRCFDQKLPRMNLRDFGFLRVLEVGSCCLKSSHPCVTRSGVYGLLPPSLQELRIIFNSIHDFMDIDINEVIDESDEETTSDEEFVNTDKEFTDRDEELTDTDEEAIIEADAKETNEDVHRSYPNEHASEYDWLKELADHKAEFLPELGRVVFILHHHTSAFDRSMQWVIPRTVAEAFEAAGIDVNVRLKELPGHSYLLGTLAMIYH